MELKGKVALITGAGSGIGRSTALLFAKEGACVVACDVDEESVEKTVNSIRSQDGEAIASLADVSKASEIRTTVEKAVQTFGGLNILYNNAGIWLEEDGPTTTVSEKIWNQIINVNLKGTFLSCKFAIPHLVQAGGGSIINVSSISALRAGKDNYVTYAASKGGIISLTYTLASNWGNKGIRANVICPGSIETPLTAQSYENTGVRNFWKDRTAVGRVGQPKEVAQTALWLASSDSSYVTGALILVDGGYMTK